MAENFVLTSEAFKHGDMIPIQYTCDDQDISPPLRWRGVPEDTRSLVLLCDDPDAPRGVWSHWVFYNIPANRSAFGEDMPPDEIFPWGGTQGFNDFRRIGYGGPCPPPGPAHRYFFRLYALDTALNLSPGLNRQQVLDRIEGHIMGQAELMGRYARANR